MIIFFTIFFLIPPYLANAFSIEKCGNYKVEGYYTEISSNLHNGQQKKVILLNRNSRSEIIFYIKNKNIEKLIPDTHLRVDFKLTLQFISLCFNHCEGFIKSIEKPLDPFLSPEYFSYFRTKIIRGTEIPCLPNSFEADHINKYYKNLKRNKK